MQSYGNEQYVSREAVGVFTDLEALNAAVAELETTAFPRHDISVLSAQSNTPAQIAEDDPAAPRTILVRPEEKTIGAGVIIAGGAYAGAVTALLALGPAPIVGVIVMAILGAMAGAVMGGALVWLISNHLRQSWRHTVSNGGMVLWVRTPGIRAEKMACAIMSKHGAHDIHVHDRQ